MGPTWAGGAARRAPGEAMRLYSAASRFLRLPRGVRGGRALPAAGATRLPGPLILRSTAGIADVAGRACRAATPPLPAVAVKQGGDSGAAGKPPSARPPDPSSCGQRQALRTSQGEPAVPQHRRGPRWPLRREGTLAPQASRRLQDPRTPHPAVNGSIADVAGRACRAATPPRPAVAVKEGGTLAPQASRRLQDPPWRGTVRRAAMSPAGGGWRGRRDSHRGAGRCGGPGPRRRGGARG